MIHPLAIAYLETQAAYIAAPLCNDAAECAAYVKAHTAWRDAGCPVHATLPTEAPPGFIRVRIAVAVCADGAWEASSAFTGGQRHEQAGDGLDAPYRTSYVTADVPLPEPAAEIVAEVARG